MTWKPNTDEIKKTNAYKEYTKQGFQTWQDYYKWSITDTTSYWRSVEQHFQLQWEKTYDEVISQYSSMDEARFFTNGKINLVHDALQKYPSTDTPFIFYEREDGYNRSYSSKQWKEEIYKVAYSLHKKGVKKGDTVLFYSPMTIELTVLFFAVTLLGAVVCPVFSGFKKDSVAARLKVVQAKWMVAAESTIRNGKMIPVINEILPLLDRKEISGCILLPSTDSTDSPEKRSHEKVITYEELLQESGKETYIPFLDANDRSLVLFTSGTTGNPKAIVHTQLGFPLKSAWDSYIGWNVSTDNCLFWFTDLGWMMGPFVLWSALLNQTKLVLYEGSLLSKSKLYFFHFINKYKITHAGISPGFVRSISNELQEAKKITMPTLQSVGATGEPWSETHWRQLSFYLGNEKGFPIFNYSGGTEISGGIFANLMILPQKECAFNTALPGMNVKIVPSSENRKTGELTMLSPWLGMTIGFYGETLEKFKQTYFKETNQWFHGDFVEQSKNNYYIRGRSDDTLNIGGKRIGPQEIENVLLFEKQVVECAVISTTTKEKGEVIIAFLVCRAPVIEEELQCFIDNHIGKMFRPYRYYFVEDLPKTRNGKVMRRLLKKVYDNETIENTSALVNPHVLDEIRQAVRLKKGGSL